MPVSLLDVPATLVDIAGQGPARPMEGWLLAPAVNGAELEVVPVISEYHGEGIMRPSFLARLGDWKYHDGHGLKAYLFNLLEDPSEWYDRAGNLELAKIKLELGQVITGENFELKKNAKDV